MRRFRVFAGPNGSGKSTIIRAVEGHKVNGRPIDFGVYVNADDIGADLRNHTFSFENYRLAHVTNGEFQSVVEQSGLINSDFPLDDFRHCYQFIGKRFRVPEARYVERMAQILANFMVKRLIDEGEKCSLETVFSHPSKLEMMQRASENGYKVYLYFVATESPEINIERVGSRVRSGGHDVPSDRIVARYYRSLGIIYEAAQAAYQCYFFDNSESEHRLVAHFEVADGIKVWDELDSDTLPDWFIKYYVNKQ
jgi:predicted ABC-type ATPase